MQIHRNKDRWHKSNSTMITTQANKQTGKTKQTYKLKKATETDYATTKRVCV